MIYHKTVSSGAIGWVGDGKLFARTRNENLALRGNQSPNISFVSIFERTKAWLMSSEAILNSLHKTTEASAQVAAAAAGTQASS